MAEAQQQHNSATANDQTIEAGREAVALHERLQQASERVEEQHKVLLESVQEYRAQAAKLASTS